MSTSLLTLNRNNGLHGVSILVFDLAHVFVSLLVAAPNIDADREILVGEAVRG